MPFVSGAKSTFDGSEDHILDLRDGLDFLSPSNDGIDFLKRIGFSSNPAKSFKYEWTETDLAARGETVTLADAIATELNVADAYIYQVNDLIEIENEVVRVTAVAPGGVATKLTIVRGYAGTTAALHTAKYAALMGSADPEGSEAPKGSAGRGRRLFNYVQTFTRGVSLTNDEIAQLSTDGNPLDGELERRFIEVMRQVARAVLYGRRYEDVTGKIHVMGGLKQFITTNVTNLGGALTIAAIDAQLLNIVNAGGDPKLLMMSPTVKQKLDALDNNKQMLGKKEHTGGGLITNTWQSGILGHTLDILVDPTMKTDELWILNTDDIELKPLVHNGVDGHFKVENSTPNGADYESKVIRGKCTMHVGQEKGHGYIYAIA